MGVLYNASSHSSPSSGLMGERKLLVTARNDLARKIDDCESARDQAALYKSWLSVVDRIHDIDETLRQSSSEKSTKEQSPILEIVKQMKREA